MREELHRALCDLVAARGASVDGSHGFDLGRETTRELVDAVVRRGLAEVTRDDGRWARLSVTESGRRACARSCADRLRAGRATVTDEAVMVACLDLVRPGADGLWVLGDGRSVRPEGVPRVSDGEVALDGGIVDPALPRRERQVAASELVVAHIAASSPADILAPSR